jgi:isocitrate/isopropylmalate dehydrogenase
MLRYLGLSEATDRLWSAVKKVTKKGEHLTKDLGGRATTMEMADAIIAEMR